MVDSDLRVRIQWLQYVVNGWKCLGMSLNHHFCAFQIRSQGGGQVLDLERAGLHPRHGRQREGPDGLTQGRRIQAKVRA